MRDTLSAIETIETERPNITTIHYRREIYANNILTCVHILIIVQHISSFTPLQNMFYLIPINTILRHYLNLAQE